MTSGEGAPAAAAGAPTGAPVGQRSERDRVEHDVEALVARALAAVGAPPAGVLAVLLVDVRGVGRLDRALGHGAGGTALRELGERLARMTRPHATLARFTRDRFVLLERVADADAATRVAAQILTAVDAPFAAGSLSGRLAATVGIALAHDASARAGDLLRDADVAAHHAHTAGEGGWVLADPALRERSLRRLRLEHELGAALARDELTLHFQPIVSLRRGTVLGIEALVRWRHPQRGLLGAGHFIPAAERSGLILEIGDWVLTQVCRQVADWDSSQPGRALPPVTVNVSPHQLREQAFVSRLSSALRTARVAPRSISLDIAASGTAGGADRPLETMEAIRRLGVQIVLDGFGGEGSSLLRLARLPLDGLKLDRAFVSGLCAKPDPAPIAEAVVDVGHALGLRVTAPGIETAQQLAVVRALSIDAAQGHLIARPSPVATLSDLAALTGEVAALAPAIGVEPAHAGGDELVTLSVVAAALGVSSSTARRLADQGVLPGTRTEGGHRRFRRSDVERVARERRRAPSLKPWLLPAEALHRVAHELEHGGAALVERTARTIYELPHSGWFAASRGLVRARQWIAALGAAIGAGANHDAIEATAEYAEAALLAGASPAECVRFLGQFATIARIELIREHVPAEEVRSFQRLMGAATEAFLARLTR